MTSRCDHSPNRKRRVKLRGDISYHKGHKSTVKGDGGRGGREGEWVGEKGRGATCDGKKLCKAVVFRQQFRQTTDGQIEEIGNAPHVFAGKDEETGACVLASFCGYQSVEGFVVIVFHGDLQVWHGWIWVW